jgi:mannose-6-phosphate isomerase-like protein (cupin superfamily)
VRIVRLKDYPRRPAHYLFGDLYTTLAQARETGNRFNTFDFQVPPGGGPVPHNHGQEWEIFFVLQGTPTFLSVHPTPPFHVMEETASPGTAVYGPQCGVHGFKNNSSAPVRIFAMSMPAGLDNFFHLTGDEVEHYYAPIPPFNEEQIPRLAFWGEKTGGEAYIPNTPPPTCPGALEHVVSSIGDPRRPRETGPFGETRVVLLTPQEVGNASTSATAFCGPGAPGRPGGTVKYSYFSLPGQNDFPTFHVSGNTEVFYTLGGTLSFLFDNDGRTKRVQVDPLTHIAIEPGVRFSIANLQHAGPVRRDRGDRRPGNVVPAQALAISVIAPVCQ